VIACVIGTVPTGCAISACAILKGEMGGIVMAQQVNGQVVGNIGLYYAAYRLSQQ
jgi:hypothetical protein